VYGRSQNKDNLGGLHGLFDCRRHKIYWLYDLLERNEKRLSFLIPLRPRLLSYLKIKNDKIDSKVLAHLLIADLLPLSFVPSKCVRLQWELPRYRTSLVRVQTGIWSWKKNKRRERSIKNLHFAFIGGGEAECFNI
jgi:hypothetical protein